MQDGRKKSHFHLISINEIQSRLIIVPLYLNAISIYRMMIIKCREKRKTQLDVLKLVHFYVHIKFFYIFLQQRMRDSAGDDY